MHSSILARRIPMDRGAWWSKDHGITKSQTLSNEAPSVGQQVLQRCGRVTERRLGASEQVDPTQCPREGSGAWLGLGRISHHLPSPQLCLLLLIPERGTLGLHCYPHTRA